MTAINHKDVYAIWIEDDKFNVVSEISYASLNEEVDIFNNSILEDNINNVLSKAGVEINKEHIDKRKNPIITNNNK